MSILGTAGSIYMTVLIMLLIIGFGLAGLWMIDLAFGANKKVTNQKVNAAAKGTNTKTK